MSIVFNQALLELLLSDGQSLNKFIPGTKQEKVTKDIFFWKLYYMSPVHFPDFPEVQAPEGGDRLRVFSM